MLQKTGLDYNKFISKTQKRNEKSRKGYLIEVIEMIKNLLKKELIVTHLEGGVEKATALQAISKICSEYSGLDERQLCEKFLEREAMDSTGFGNHVAIPHAKIEGLKAPFIGIFKMAQDVEWEALDDEPVRTAIVLVMPGESADTTHIQVLSKFSRKLMDDDFIEVLLTETNEEALYNFVLSEMEG